MSRVFCDMSVSLDGYVAGPNQSAELPFGEGVDGRLHTWMFERAEENAEEIHAIVDAEAFIMGRHMFGPDRDEWDLNWSGWWGPEPPYHRPVFVLGHRSRDRFVMEGGTTFVFVTDGTESALSQACLAAGPDGRVAIAGGAATARQYLRAGLVDELRLHIVPVVIGAGERLLDDVGHLQLTQRQGRPATGVVHMTFDVVGGSPTSGD
jgi:dihydrofolate reductase